MNYTVVYLPEAEAELAAVWIAAADRGAVAAASHTIELLIGTAPLSNGESRSSGVERVLFWAPRGVQYTVIEDDKRVVVQAVWAAG